MNEHEPIFTKMCKDGRAETISMLLSVSILEVNPVVWKFHLNAARDCLCAVFAFTQPIEVPHVAFAVGSRNMTSQPLGTASFEHTPRVPSPVSRYMSTPAIHVVFGLVRTIVDLKRRQIADCFPQGHAALLASDQLR
jgi:hypothetical protein